MNRKSSEEIKSTLEKELDQGLNFIDYFLVIGSDPKIFKNDWLYDCNIKEINSKYQEEISPKILSKFPPFEKHITGIDETIVNHCFPKGFEMEEHDKKPQNLVFSILLDNNNYSQNFPYKYVTCLKFYESVYSYRELYNKINSQSGYRNDEMSISINNYTYPKANIPFSTRESIQTESNIDSESWITTTTRNTTGSIRIKYKKYYLPKCICLISLHPFIIEFSRIIKAIYSYSIVSKSDIPLEKLIENLAVEIPVPPRGIYSIEYELINEKRMIEQSPMNNLPTLNIEFDSLFNIFSLENVIEIFRHLMLNARLVFFSTDISVLTPLILTSLSLIFPFYFPYNVVSILPRGTYNLIDNIPPVVVGINEKYTESFFMDNDVDVSDIILVIDVDNRKIKEIKHPNVQDLPQLPKKPKEALLKKVRKFLEEKKGSRITVKEKESTIRNLFLNFQVKILENYSKYLNNDIYSHQNYKNPIQSAFKVNEFIETITECDRDFYKQFLETQMFCDFIYKRMTPKEQKEKVEILFFEEKIFEKQNKHRMQKNQLNTVFLSSREFDIKKTHKVKPRKTLSQAEINYFSMEDKARFLDDGVYISTSRTNPNSPSFTYYIFPRLQSEFFFRTNIRNYYLIPNYLSEEVFNINSDLIAKSHLNSIEIKTCEMENYIYLSWLKLWAFSFWYYDKDERKYRFEQMLSVLDMVIHHEMEVFNNLFEVLIEADTDKEKLLKLYDKVLSYRLNPSVYIFEIVKKIVDKTKRTSPTSKKTDPRKLDCRGFRKRTFKNKYENKIISENIKFGMTEICDSCGGEVDLYQLIKNINDANKEICWAICPKCKNLFLPKLTIRFGFELNKNNSMTQITSVQDSIVLYSPYTLYYTMIGSIVKENKIDIDNFKKNFSPLFWNFIWYFKAQNLPYDFLLPYESNIIYYPKEKMKHCLVYFTEKLDVDEEESGYKKTRSKTFDFEKENVVELLG